MKKLLLLTKTLLVAVCLLVGATNAWATDANIFTANATANLSVPASTTDQELTSTNATIKGGKMFVTNGQTSAKGLIATAPDENFYFVMTNGNTSFKVTSNHALKVGDKIKFDVYYNHDGGSTDLGLWFTTASSRPGSAPTASKAESVSGGASKTMTYTVAEGDGICGQSTFYIYRSSGTTTYFKNVVITRDYTTVFSQNYSGSDYASGWSAATSGRVGWTQYTRTDITGETTALLVFHNGNNNGASSTYSSLNNVALYTSSTDYKVEFDMALQGNYGSTTSNLTSTLVLNTNGGKSITFSIPPIKNATDGYNATVAYNSGSGNITLGYLYKEASTNTYDGASLNSTNAPTTFKITKVYHVTIMGDDSGTYITVTGDLQDGEKDAKTSVSAQISASFERITTFVFSSGRGGGQQVMLDNLIASIHSDVEFVPNPTAAITGVSGTDRTVTLTLGTGSADGSTMAYSTNSDMSESTAYSAPFTVSSTGTIYFQTTSPSSAKSDIQSINVTCEAVKLNTPVISRSGNTVTITQDQSDLDASPSATIYYTYGAGDPVAYSSAITVEADATITAYASATGYTNSDNATRAVAVFPTNVVKIINAPQNKSYESGALSGVDVVGTNTTFQALILDGTQWGGENVYVPKSNFGYRNDGNSWYFGSTSNVWLLVKNLKAGDIIVANTDYKASGLTNATYTEKYSEGYNFAYTVTADGDVEIAFKKPNSSTMHYFYGLYVWSSHYVSKTITAAGWATYCSDKALDFSSSIANLTKAYLVTGTEGETTTLALTDITGTIPANTGILLEGEGEVSIPVATSSSTDVSANKLVGVTSNTPIVAEAGYVLMNETAGVGFYKNKNAFTVGANTAYLPADFNVVNQGARAYFFRGNITGVENIEVAEATAKKNGAYLENGKIAIYKNGMKFNANGQLIK